MALLFALAGAFTLVAPAGAAVSPAVHHGVHVFAQQTETVDPTNTGPDLNPPQENRSIGADTKKKLWIGGIAVLLFALVYWRNKRRYNKWRKARKAAAG
ncbi:hypothetical protein [Umezawaea tangerina]|uniref:hypothetical protein n=1 Tax=Umezawaea tangerina TaxID=84725 RepID=UPI000D04E68B|nr:hypothetical protein [Umezawaea tangerina]